MNSINIFLYLSIILYTTNIAFAIIIYNYYKTQSPFIESSIIIFRSTMTFDLFAKKNKEKNNLLFLIFLYKLGVSLFLVVVSGILHTIQYNYL